MKYKIQELESMSKEKLLEIYRCANKSVKKDILISLANSRKFAELMEKLNSKELVEMAKLHPFKEVVVDTMIEEMELHGVKMSHHWKSGIWNGEKGEDIQQNFDSMEKALKHRSIFDKIKEKFSKRPTLPEQLNLKIQQVRSLFEKEQRRINSNGKRLEELETQNLDQAVDESRVEVNNGEIAKIFDKYAKEACKEGQFLDRDGVETDVAYKLQVQLTEEYTAALGKEKEDIARLVAMKEFENYSGKLLYVPYRRKLFCKKLQQCI